MTPNVKQNQNNTKRTVLTIQDKLKLLEKLENGATTSSVCKEYGIARQTVSDLKKKKGEIIKFSKKFNIGDGRKCLKRMKTPTHEKLDKAIFTWYVQQQSLGIDLKGIDIQAAAERFAFQFGIDGFKASNGWLCKFRNRHNIRKNQTKERPTDVFLTENEIIETVYKTSDSEDDNDQKKNTTTNALVHLTHLMNYVNQSKNEEITRYYKHLSNLHQLIKIEQNATEEKHEDDTAN